jgi:G3E family GTPase
MAKIPAVVVSGFLGSGKTTFILKSLLPRLKGRKISVVVNDFGEINYDKIRLYQEGLEVYGIEGNCFCCELGGEFLNTLASIKRQGVEFLVVETSGVSDPSPIYYSLESSGFSVELIMGVFALDIDEGLLKHPLLQAQMDASHCFVLTKADLLPERDVLRKLKPFLEWQKPTFLAKEGYVEEDIESLFGQVQEKPRGGGKHQSFESYTLRLKGFYSKLEVGEFFRKLPRNIYRAKGIIHCLESPLPLSLNYSFGNLTWERLEVEEEPFLVFIGDKIDHKLFEEFPRSQRLSYIHEKQCFPLGDFDAREGVGYIKGNLVDELETAEKLLEELEEGDFLFVSGEAVSFEEFLDIKKFCEDLKNSHFKRLVLWKVPSGVVSYLLEHLPPDKLVYHLGKHYLLPKAYLSLRVDTKEKEDTLLSLISRSSVI